MILGRNTQQWMGLITSVISFVGVVIGVAAPGLLGPATIILNGLTGVLGVVIMFIANSLTTPVNDARIPVGTVIGATDPLTGMVVGHVKVPEPAPAPVAPDVGPAGDDLPPDDDPVEDE